MLSMATKSGSSHPPRPVNDPDASCLGQMRALGPARWDSPLATTERHVVDTVSHTKPQLKLANRSDRYR
ncbi:hypothetical protein F750_7084 (plasmid) [Streptomyces sp. PAMC 26508]|nr:hypothetical protein F750_7084 [Streptomyces sp. PAMC 26508]